MSRHETEHVEDIHIVAFVIITAIVLALASPVFYVAWKKGRFTTLRNFAIGALLIGVLGAALEGVSERQVEQCLAAGNTDCFDSGTIGLQLLFVILFTVSAWSVAFVMYRE